VYSVSDDLVELLLTVDRQVWAFRLVLSQQPVGVPLTHCHGLCGAVKPIGCTGLLIELGMLHHLFALILGHGQEQGVWFLTELSLKPMAGHGADRITKCVQ